MKENLSRYAKLGLAVSMATGCAVAPQPEASNRPIPVSSDTHVKFFKLGEIGATFEVYRLQDSDNGGQICYITVPKVNYAGGSSTFCPPSSK